MISFKSIDISCLGLHNRFRLIWLLDWEMARYGDIALDASQLLDNLWVMQQNPAKYRQRTIKNLIEALQLQYFSGGDWRLGRAVEFVRSIALLLPFPHWGISRDNIPDILERAMSEVESIV